jgi:hypothetical protein
MRGPLGFLRVPNEVGGKRNAARGDASKPTLAWQGWASRPPQGSFSDSIGFRISPGIDLSWSKSSQGLFSPFFYLVECGIRHLE